MNRKKRNSIHINTKRFNLLSNIPKLNIPASESTRIPTSTNRRLTLNESNRKEIVTNPIGNKTDRVEIERKSTGLPQNFREDSLTSKRTEDNTNRTVEFKRLDTVKAKVIDSDGEASDNMEFEVKKVPEKVEVILEEAESEAEGDNLDPIPSTSRMKKSLADKSKEIIESLVKKFGEEQIKTSLQEAFDDSEILKPKEASFLYLNCLSENLEVMPTTECLELYSINDLPSPIDVLNLLSDHPQSTIFLFKFRGQKFGAFASTNWFNEGESGTERNFLFNLNKDHKIVVDKKKKRKVFQWRDDHGMGWGATDLVFHEDVFFSFFNRF